MAIYRGTYYAASSCSGFARPGARELMAWFLGAYSARGAANLGIYNCKSLGSGVSIHGDGRAGDLGTAPYNSPGGDWPAWGLALADQLRLHSAELGIQLIIFRRRVWSCRYPDSGWRGHAGDPHDGHLHVELTPTSAATLTAAKVQSTIGGSDMMRLPRQGETGEHVEFYQRALSRDGHSPGAFDGAFGPATTAATNASRAARNWSPVNPGRITPAHAIALFPVGGSSGGATDAQVRAAVEAYLKANPPKPGKDGQTPTRVTIELTGDVTAYEAS